MRHTAYLGAETDKQPVPHDSNSAAIRNTYLVWSVARFYEVSDGIAHKVVSTEIGIVAIVGRAQFHGRGLVRRRGESSSRITHELHSYMPRGVVHDDSDRALAHPVIDRAVR